MNIVGLVHNYVRRELICVTTEERGLSYNKVLILKDIKHDGETAVKDVVIQRYEPVMIDSR